jgi:hypothetical protein
MTDKPTPANEVAEANLLNNTERAWATENHPDACNTIRAWAQANDWQAVIWTALSSNFAEALHQPFTVQAALDYLNGLAGETRAKAFEYIRRAPPETLTPLCRKFFNLALDEEP